MMKKTDLAKGEAKKLMGQMGKSNATFRSGDATPVDRREQRERERALGLVPFAVKLNGELVQRLQALAKERGVEMNQLVAQVLEKGLAE